MTEESKAIIAGDKYAEIIKNISEMYAVSVETAADIFYNSITLELIEDGVADLHCRSEKYLAQCVMDEYEHNR